MDRASLGRFLRAAAAAALLGGITTGCGDILSKPMIRDADNDNVVFMGDSIFALSGEIQQNLHARAGGTFRNYTTSGAELNGGLIQPTIVAQYAMAFADDPTSQVFVMNGGGNDILIPTLIGDPFDCLTGIFEFGRLSRKCQDLVADIRVEATDLLNQMAANGATDVIYLGYYYTKNGLIGRDSLEQAVNFGDDMIAAGCADAVLNCTFIDPRRAINDRDIVADGVHPNASGSRKLADLIWPVLATKL